MGAIMLPEGVERRGWRVALLYTLTLGYLMCCPRIVPPQKLALARVDGPHAEDGSPTDAVIRAALLQEINVRVPTLLQLPETSANLLCGGTSACGVPGSAGTVST